MTGVDLVITNNISYLILEALDKEANYHNFKNWPYLDSESDLWYYINNEGIHEILKKYESLSNSNYYFNHGLAYGMLVTWRKIKALF
jgi:glucan-binding YG repeat protein